MVAVGLAGFFMVSMILNIGYLYSKKQYRQEKLKKLSQAILSKSKWWVRIFKGGRNTGLALFIVILADHVFK